MFQCDSCELGMMVTEYGTMVCVGCGVENFRVLLSTEHACIPYSVPLHTPATYTRVKRFKKYLQRASMNQSASTIPEATWVYLMKGGPYRGPGYIVRRLKKAPKEIRKKCYDSLPLLVQMLCPHIEVPRLSESDKMRALVAFNKLDKAYCEGEPFVSYLFALEYILQMVGRQDVLPFINKISCRKRRVEYRRRLDRGFADQ